MLNKENEVIEWARVRGILDSSDPKSQFIKTVYEMGELADAVNKGENVKDHVGDVLVTLILLCYFKSVTLDECLDVAYEEIKNRKGKMVNGTFIKEVK